MKILLSLLFVVLAGCTSVPFAKKNTTQVAPPLDAALDSEKRLQKIAFASCANQDAPAPLWKNILNEKADIFVFMGDNVYASNPMQQPIGLQYDKQSQVPDYVALRSSTPTIAIWDDHDYGANDGGQNNPLKNEARREFMRHFPYAQKTVPTAQEGIYHSLEVGPQNENVQFVLLDTRWNRSDLVKAKNPRSPFHKFDPNTDPKSTILGEEQWAWLENELNKKARIHVIVSSIHFIPEAHGFEKWGNFPHERQRLLNLIAKLNLKNVVIISGDRHIGTIAKTKLKNGKDLYEITSSAINRPGNFSEQDPTYIGTNVQNENYGLMQIDWVKKKILFELKNKSGETPLKTELKLL